MAKLKFLIGAHSILGLIACSMSQPTDIAMDHITGQIATPRLTTAEAAVAIAVGSCLKLADQTISGVGLTTTRDMDIAAGNIRGAISQQGANSYTINGLRWTPIPGGTRLDVDVTTLRCVESLLEPVPNSQPASESVPNIST